MLSLSKRLTYFKGRPFDRLTLTDCEKNRYFPGAYGFFTGALRSK